MKNPLPESWSLSFHQYRYFILSLSVLWALFFLGHSWEEGLKMDAMENVSIAKFILSTGDWTHFRYEAEAYSNYYNHPPLLIWIEALAFKLLGTSDAVARIAPALFGLGTLIGVVIWGQIAFSIEVGLLAGLILLTSNRYVKFASDALLEGPLSFFLVWGAIFFLRSQENSTRRRFSDPFMLGLCLAFAVLTKSVFFIILPISILMALVVKWAPLKNSTRTLGFSLLGFCLVLGFWFWLGDGYNFLINHYTAISSRVETRSWATLFVPLKNVVTTYWPWLPFFLWSSSLLLKSREHYSLGGYMALMMALVVLMGFSLSGHFFEHYLTTFYPPAAVLSALSFHLILKNRFKQTEKVLWGLSISLAIALAVLPIKLRRNRAEPLATTLREMSAVCKGQSEILISQQAIDRWLAVAITLWKTPYEIKSVESLNISAGPTQLLITAQNEAPPIGAWQKVPLCLSQYNLYQPQRTPLCR